MSKEEKKKSYITPIIFYIVSVFIYYIAFKEIHLKIRPDSMRYYDLAYEIAHKMPLIINKIPAIKYCKLLYPLYIAPATLIENSKVQSHVIILLNVIAYLSAIFPLNAILNFLNVETKKRVPFFLFCVTFPQIYLNVCIMSECVSLPLALWTIYLWLITKDKLARPATHGLLLGALMFITYMGRELFLVFPLAILAYEMLGIVETCIKNRRVQINISKGKLIYYGLAIGIFACAYIIFTYIIFDGNSYATQTGLSVFKEDGVIKLALYDMCVYIAAFLLMTFVLPLPLLLLNKSVLSQNAKTIIKFVIIDVCILTAALGYTYFPKDCRYQGTEPDLIMRYLDYAAFLTMAVFLSEIEKLKIKGKKTIIVIALIIIACCALITRTGDSTFLLLEAYNLYACAIVVYALMIMYFIVKKENNKRLFYILSIIGALNLILFCVFVKIAYQQNNDYMQEYEQVLDEISDDAAVWVESSTFALENNCENTTGMDIYVTSAAALDDAVTIAKTNGEPIKIMSIYYYNYTYYTNITYPTMPQVDYIIFEEKPTNEDILSHIEYDEKLSTENIYVYKNIDLLSAY